MRTRPLLFTLPLPCKALRLCLTALLPLVASMPANAAFLAENSDGVSICYAIVSYDDRTVEVTSDFNGSLYSGSVNIPARVREGTRAYYYSVIGIGDDAFYNCTGLTDVVIPGSVTSIGDKAFYNCTGLTEVTLPNSVTSIGGDAFEYTGLTDVVIPGSVTSIGVNAFGDCGSLTKIEVAEDSKYFCSKDGVLFTKDMTELLQCPCALPLASYDIPDGVTTIGRYAFRGCTGLTEVTLPNSVTEIGRYAFHGCTGLMEVTLPDGVTTIGSDAFYGCTGLRQVTIGNSVTTIGSDAFYGCTGLTEVTLPNSVTTIGGWAFYGCKGLKSITSLNTTPPSCDGSYVFSGVPTSTCVLYVPRGSKASYSTATGWKGFVNIVEMGVYSPTVQTGEATEITYNSATLNAAITAGSEEILEQGFEYWTADGKVMTATSATGEDMSVTLTDLPPNTAYTYRAYVTTKDETVYGEEMTFTTAVLAAPTVQTDEASNIGGYSATLNGSVVPGSEEILEQGFEYWILAQNKDTIEVEGEVMSVTLTGLKLSTTYSYRAYAMTVSGTTYGRRMTFTTADVGIAVQTLAATDVSSTSATLNGTVIADGEEVLERGFEYWTADGDVKTSASVASEDIYVTLTGLTRNTTYTYRAYATTESGTTYGEEMTFTTTDVGPNVQTLAATDVSSTSATLNGIVIADGREEILEQGFEYWVLDGQTYTIRVDGEDMSITLTGFSPGTTYTYRTYATTESGTIYGEEMTFTTTTTTAVVPPTVTTNAVTDITATSATLNATIIAGSEEILEQGFEYWFYAEEKNKQTILMDEGTMSATPTGLRSGATHDCRAYAVTASGTTYGNTVRFNTNLQTGIEDILSAHGSDDTRIYNLAGHRVLTTERGGVYIFRNPDGTVRKEVVK